jgi:Sulfotransferase domain
VSERSPHFVIAGAPKAGTTSLYEYLLQHPNVFMPAKKEPVFFCGYEREFRGPGSEVFNENLVVEEEEYLGLFSEAPAGSVTGEASTDYLSCPESPYRLKEWNPSARIVICLRNPIERAYSEHMHLVRDMLETKTFRDALELEEERAARSWIPLFWHVKRGLYYESVRRYLDAFGDQRVKVILHEELTRSPASVVEGIFEFLGIASVPVGVAEQHNASGRPRLRKLQAFLLHENRVKSAIKRLAPRKIRTRVKEAALSANLRRSAVSEEDFGYLKDRFAVDVEKLQGLLDVNLEHWMRHGHPNPPLTTLSREGPYPGGIG